MGASGSRPRVSNRPFRPDATRTRKAYTLIELLLVLAILIIVAGAVAPSVVGMMADHRLKETTEAVRNALARTRIHAIDTGSVYQFRVEPRGRHFIAVPTDAAALPNSGSSLPPSAVEAGQLDDGFSFEVVAATPTAGSAVPMTLAASDPAFSAMVAKVNLNQDFGASTWSSPVVFQPDGRAIDASFNIVDQHGDGFRIRVRELTGEVFVERRQ